MTTAPSALQQPVETVMFVCFARLLLYLCILLPFHLRQYGSTSQPHLRDRLFVHVVTSCSHQKIDPGKQRRQLNLRRLAEEIYGGRSQIYIWSLVAARRWMVRTDGAHIPDLSSRII